VHFWSGDTGSNPFVPIEGHIVQWLEHLFQWLYALLNASLIVMCYELCCLELCVKEGSTKMYSFDFHSSV